MDRLGLRTSRWIVGGVAFVAAATIFFEAPGQSSPRPVGVRPNAYQVVAPGNRDVKAALDFAIAEQKKKNRSDGAIVVRRLLSAERQTSNGENFRLCLALDRRGRADTARTVVHRNEKHAWSVALWAWGACGNK